jgi:hypothetical protein
MTWKRCAMDILGAQQKQQITKIILRSLLGVFYVLAICST